MKLLMWKKSFIKYIVPYKHERLSIHLFILLSPFHSGHFLVSIAQPSQYKWYFLKCPLLFLGLLFLHFLFAVESLRNPKASTTLIISFLFFLTLIHCRFPAITGFVEVQCLFSPQFSHPCKQTAQLGPEDNVRQWGQ